MHLHTFTPTEAAVLLKNLWKTEECVLTACLLVPVNIKSHATSLSRQEILVLLLWVDPSDTISRLSNSTNGPEMAACMCMLTAAGFHHWNILKQTHSLLVDGLDNEALNSIH